MPIKLILAAAATAAIGFLYWQNMEAADGRGYDRCMAESRKAVETINREVLGGNAEHLRRWIELQGRLKVLSVDALTGVKNMPACAASECALDGRFIDRLEEIRK